ncbi:DUF397 domain-containing protein [Plantactinospora veratri]|uniref:DUF397 domain-containing protein n=1 Tax=Plantactinospora veratri TaxID=1436122 RepID=UPI0038B46FB5
MKAITGSAPHWVRSTKSIEGNCIEVAVTSGGVLVRDSKDEQGPTLYFRRGMWQGFIGGVRAGGTAT